MIGGIDLTIEHAVEPGLILSMIVRTIGNRWEEAVAQDADSDVAMPAANIPFARTREVFVFRDRAAFSSWNTDGATKENLGSMIHVLVGPAEATLVVDEENAMVRSVLDSVGRQWPMFGMAARAA